MSATEAEREGTGGGLRYLEERPTARMVNQERSHSCQAACALQLLRDAGIEVTEQELLNRVQKALDRDRTVRDQLRGHEAMQLRLETLTPREREVLEAVAKGGSNKVIAHELGISQRTVEIHRGRVMQKMNAESLAQLVHMATALGVTHLA